MENSTTDGMPWSIPDETVESTNESLRLPSVTVTTDDDDQLTSQTTSRDDIIESTSAFEDGSSVTSSSRDDESIRPNRRQRPSKAERILGLTSRDFESASTEARSCQGGTPPPTNLQLKPNIGSPRRTRRHGNERISSPSSPLHATPKRCTSNAAAPKSTGGLNLTPERLAFSPVVFSSITDLKLIGNGSEVDSDADEAFTPKKSSEHRGRDRFKKILLPATRSKSAGASERAPAFALFLRYQHEHKPSIINRSTDDVMRNSADYTGSEEETTDGNHSGKLPGRSKQKKERFSFLRHSRCSSPIPALLPSLETLQGWTRSFEKLLTDKYGIKLFREFLRREFSDENLEFWIECEKFRHLTSEKHRITESKKIFREFVAVHAPSEINLDAKTREATEMDLSRADPRLFESAQKRIESLMEKDSYPRFIQSDLFQRLLHQRQVADNSLQVT